jgi:hypothetical protein
VRQTGLLASATYAGEKDKGDDHFVRQYDNKDGTKGWSQMCGIGGEITDKCHYDGTKDKNKKIEDPAKDLEGSGYHFCQYFCGCSSVEVAMVPAGAGVLVADCTTDAGKGLPLVCALDAATAATAPAELEASLGDGWSPDFTDARFCTGSRSRQRPYLPERPP